MQIIEGNWLIEKEKDCNGKNEIRLEIFFL